MKQHDFLPNLLLVLLTGILAAGISHLAARGGLPVRYTSNSRVQLTGEELHTGDVKDYITFVRSDATVLLSTVANLDLTDNGGRPLPVDQLVRYVTVSSVPLEGIIDVSVRTDDPIMSRDIANEIVNVSGHLFESSHTGIRVNRIETALAAEECDKRPIGLYTMLGGVAGLLAGAAVAFLAVRKMRSEKRMKRQADSRNKKAMGDRNVADEELFADDNEDVDPEMRELYKTAKKMAEENEESGEDFTEISDEEPHEDDTEDFAELSEEEALHDEAGDFAELKEEDEAEADGQSGSEDFAEFSEVAYDEDADSAEEAVADDFVDEESGEDEDFAEETTVEESQDESSGEDEDFAEETTVDEPQDKSSGEDGDFAEETTVEESQEESSDEGEDFAEELSVDESQEEGSGKDAGSAKGPTSEQASAESWREAMEIEALGDDISGNEHSAPKQGGENERAKGGDTDEA